VSVILNTSPVPLLENKESDSLKWVMHILCDFQIPDAPVIWPKVRDNQLISCICTYLALSLDDARNDN
jgi:hypothetical protein